MAWTPPLLVFPHIMKTAGTSVNHWIEQHYHRHHVLHEASIWQELLELPRPAWTGKRFVRGHFGSFITKFFGPAQGFQCMTLLRDPVERVVSHYWHCKRAVDTEFYLLARDDKFTIDDFLDHPETARLASNFQVANLAYDMDLPEDQSGVAPRIAFKAYVGETELHRAKAFLERADVLGFVEALPAFVEALAGRFGFYRAPELARMRSYRQNQDWISAAARQKICARNELDCELYAWARGRSQATGTKSRKPNGDHGGTMMSTPLGSKDDPLIHWHVQGPFFGSGWSDVQCPRTLDAPPHRWILNATDGVVLLTLKRGVRYALSFEIFRFLHHDQVGSFSLWLDGQPLSVTGPAPSERAGQPGGGIYAAVLPPREAELCHLTFRVGRLVTFNAVNPADTDQTPRGLALVSLTLVAMPDLMTAGASPTRMPGPIS